MYYACIGCDEHGFFRLPTQEDLRDYDIMEAFVDTLSGAAQERLAIAISGRGAFRRFKDEVRRLGLEAQWYAWHDDAYRRKAIEWCEGPQACWRQVKGLQRRYGGKDAA